MIYLDKYVYDSLGICVNPDIIWRFDTKYYDAIHICVAKARRGWSFGYRLFDCCGGPFDGIIRFDGQRGLNEGQIMKQQSTREEAEKAAIFFVNRYVEKRPRTTHLPDNEWERFKSEWGVYKWNRNQLKLF